MASMDEVFEKASKDRIIPGAILVVTNKNGQPLYSHPTPII